MPPPDRLDRLDPAAAWEPWRPAAADPWGRKWAAHLYRRAAFGPSRAELIEAERLGPGGTLDLLLNGRPEAAELTATLADVGREAGEADDGGDRLRGWWLYCVLHGGHPAREKLTLFWHNHFATSVAKVRRPALMFRQNALLREHALGRFGPLLHAVSRDPAMLVWLDSNANVKGRPNENFARELLELFALGVGNYTEADIREAARAFTGWRADAAGVRFVASLHDGGAKTVFGETGNLGGDDVIRLALARPACARHLAGKLYAFLVSETPPPDALLEPLADRLRASDYDIGALVRLVLSSRLFYSEHAFRQRVKGPAEYVVGAVKAVCRDYPEGDADRRATPTGPLVAHLAAMGQALFAPPNVKGWRGGRAWLNTSTVLARDNFAAALATGSLWSADPEPPRALDPARLLNEERVSEPGPVADALLDLYAPGGVRPAARAKLVEFLADGPPAGLPRRAREAAHAVLTMPEFQLA